MKLSDLVAFRKTLHDMNVRAVAENANVSLGDMHNVIRDHPCQFGQSTLQLQHDLVNINKGFNHFEQTLEHLILQVDQAIDVLHNRYCQESYRLYDEEMVHETTDYILNRRFGEMSPETYQFLHDRLTLYTGWKFAALIIRPGLESFIKNCVSCDPLYVADQNSELLKPCHELFPSQYSRRIRDYVFNERDETKPILHALPDNQYGFVLAFNYLNFRPFELIDKWLKEVYNKLIPGGVFAFTFNNCDLAHGVKLTEMNFMCYTPGRMIESMAQNIGYEIIFRYDTHSPNTWIELRKPGQRRSIKGGQAMAEIISKFQTENT